MLSAAGKFVRTASNGKYEEVSEVSCNRKCIVGNRVCEALSKQQSTARITRCSHMCASRTSNARQIAVTLEGPTDL